MITLGIETSCDETACAVIKNGKVLSNIVSSSVHLHSPYGGVVPEIASRYQLEYINGVFEKAIAKSKMDFKDLELIAVTYGPGLCGSLLVGISYAKSLSYALSKPLIGVNHVLAHLWANFVGKNPDNTPSFPFMGLVISGGHTNIILCRSLKDISILGNTQDDAAGEAFDKVAKILHLGYPGGPQIEKKALLFKRGEIIKFPKAYLDKGSLDFSFSGIKTSVLYYIKNKKLTDKLKAEIAYSFQEAVFDTVVEKAISACRRYGINTLVIGGGVAANKRFCKKIKDACRIQKVRPFIPDRPLCLDNATMVAALGERLYREGVRSKPDLTAETNLTEMMLK